MADHERYLNENLTPEWKRAYLDYRTCKKHIKLIARRLAREAGNLDVKPEEVDGNDSSADEDYGPSAPPRKSPGLGVSRSRSGTVNIKSPNIGDSSATPKSAGNSKASSHLTAKLISESAIWYDDLHAPSN